MLREHRLSRFSLLCILLPSNWSGRMGRRPHGTRGGCQKVAAWNGRSRRDVGLV